MLAGAWSVYAAFGLLVASLGALVPAIQADLALTDGEMGLVLGAWQLVFIVASVPAGWAIGRFGLRSALLVAVVIMVAAGLARAASTGFATLFAATALHGVGAPLISVGAPTVAARLFDGRARRQAVGVYSTAPTVGAVVGLVAPGAVLLPLTGDRWRPAMVALSAMAATAIVVWAVVSRRLPDDGDQPTEGPAAGAGGPAAGAADRDLPADERRLLDLPAVRYALALSVATFFFVHGVGQWAVAILDDSGWTSSQAGAWVALGTAGGLVASFVLPRLATPERRPLLLIGVLVLAAGAVQFLTAAGPVVLGGAVVVTFVARSAAVPLQVLSLMDHPDIGPARTAAATGLFFTTAQLGGVAGPAVTGFVAQGAGSFGPALALHGVVLIGLAGAVAVGRRRALL